ncbi:MAG: SgcJ/EcaC family oxidoreductase [Acidobacteria bacterium]|nr:SgcJ/EcaC family oxidoreductase [Acidobacteriota bacterium]
MTRTVQIRVCRAIVATVFLVTAGVAGAQTPAAPDAEFKKLADAFSQAWNKGDANGIAALHTKEGVRLAGNGQPAVVGTAALEKAFADALAGPYKGTTLTIKPNADRQAAPGVYIGEGTYEVSGGTPPPGTPMSGQYMNTMVREGGRWLIAASAVIPAATPK